MLLRREGEVINHKRLFRVYKEAGLSVRRKSESGWFVWASRSSRTAPNQEWALDFVHDRIANGRSIRVLTGVDTFTRECLALEVDSSLPSARVTRTLDEIILRRGRTPAHSARTMAVN